MKEKGENGKKEGNGEEGKRKVMERGEKKLGSEERGVRGWWREGIFFFFKQKTAYEIGQ